MKDSITKAFLLGLLPSPFGMFGIGHFYLKKKTEGIIFLIVGLANSFATLSYMPIDSQPLLTRNIFSYILQTSGYDTIPPAISIAIWIGLVGTTIVRLRSLK